MATAPEKTKVQKARSVPDELELVHKIRTLFDIARKGRDPRVSRWRENYRLVHNRFWTGHTNPHMAQPMASETYPIIAALVGWMTDQASDIEIVPQGDPHSHNHEFLAQVSRDLQTTVEAVAHNHDHASETEKMLFDGLIYGTGIEKTGWDAILDDGYGNGNRKRVDTFAFYPDPRATSDEDGNFYIEARDMSLQEADRRWPGAASMLAEASEDAGMLDERPNVELTGRQPMANPAGIGGVPPRFGKPGEGGRLAVGTNWYDRGVTVYEAWIREHVLHTDDEGEPFIDDHWRVMVMAGNRILMNESAKDLFGHGRHPFSRFVYHDMGDFWGISLVDHLRPLQIALNRLLAAAHHHAELTGNPVWLEDTMSGTQRVNVVNKPGQRVTKRAQGTIEWMTPPSMGPEVATLIEFYINEMERISGLSAIARGMTPSGRNSEGVMDAVQESAFVRVRLGQRNLERCLTKSYTMLASLIAENYTAPRLMAVVGPGGERTALALSARHFYAPTENGASPLRFSLRVSAGATQPTSRMARAARAERMFALNAIDRQAMLEAADYPNRTEILARMQQAEVAAGQAEQADTSRKRRR